MKRVSDTSPRAKAVLLLARVAGIVISLVLLFSVIYSLTKRTTPPLETVTVLVAKQDIPSQKSISSEMIGKKLFVKGFVPANALLETQAEQVIGKKILISVEKGEILSPSLFGAAKGNLDGGIANIIPEGMKLIYIQKDDVHGFPPDIQKDNFIDIIAVNQKDSTNNIEVIAERITVIDVIRSHENGTNSIESIGLLMKDSDILKLSSKFTQDWKLSLTTQPQHRNEPENSLQETASSESKLQPQVNEKKKPE